MIRLMITSSKSTSVPSWKDEMVFQLVANIPWAGGWVRKL